MGGINVLKDLGKAAFEGIQRSGVGGAVAEAGERAVTKIGEAAHNYSGTNRVMQAIAPKIEMASESTLNLAHKTFGLESQLTGPVGANLNKDLKDFEKLHEYKQAEFLNAQKQGHPAFVGAAPYEIRGMARKAARQQVFLKNDLGLAQHIDAIATVHGEEKAKNIADSLGIYFHDQVRQSGAGETSQLSSNLNRNPLTKDIGFRNSPYQGMTDIERGVHSVAHAALAPKAGIAHLTTPLNMMLGQSLSSFAKAVTQIFPQNYQGARAEIQSLNAIGSMFMEEAEQFHKYQNGLIKKFIPGSFGEFINKNWQIPFMSFIRQRTMTMAAMQGKFSSMEAAATLIDQNASHKAVELAEENLRYHGIEPMKVRSNQGQLMPEDIRSAMYENVNNRVFIQSGRNRAPAGTQNALGRLVGMYHNYGVAQSKFIQREVIRSIKRGDPIGGLKDLAVLGVVFPAVGTGVYGAEQALMGHWDKAKEAAQEAVDIINPAGYLDGKMFADRLEGISHAAGFGVLNSYSRAAGRKKLLEAIAGPIINAGTEAVQDTMSIGQGHSTKPLARDILHDIPSTGIGAYISNKMLPTQQELNKRKPMTSRRMAAKAAAARRKLKNK